MLRYIIYGKTAENTIVDAGINFDITPAGSAVLALGVFDGVHSGHRRIISTLRQMAQDLHAVPAAVTFSPHPRQVLFPADPPPLLLPLVERCRLLHEAGADSVGIINFTGELAAQKPEDFLLSLLNGQNFKVCGICVGSRWRFGKAGAGNRELIADFASEHGIVFTPCEELEMNGETVSSTAIRRCTSAGKLDLARAMLGRPVRLFGKVHSGNHVAGSVLNAPTANLEINYGVLPPDGVYSGAVKFRGRYYPAAVNIGFSPTFSVGVRRVEAHLLDFKGALYGEELELELFRRLRDEKAFPSHRELMEQISMDIIQVRNDYSGEGR